MPVSFLFLLLACRPDTPALDAYYGGMCRLLTDPVCLESQDGSCSYTLAFESQADCLDELVGGLGRCAGDAEAAVQALPQYDACLEDLSALDCETEPVCTPTPAFIAGPCLNVYNAVITACQE